MYIHSFKVDVSADKRHLVNKYEWKFWGYYTYNTLIISRVFIVTIASLSLLFTPDVIQLSPCPLLGIQDLPEVFIYVDGGLSLNRSVF